MNIGNRVREDKKRPPDQFGQDPVKGKGEVILLNLDGWVFGTIEREVDPEPCSSCGHAVEAVEPRWRVVWSDGRETEQYESTLVAG